MAYATDNPLRKIAEGGINSVWLYVDGDAVGTIAGSGYFNSDYGKTMLSFVLGLLEELKQ